MQKECNNNGTEEIALVTPTPVHAKSTEICSHISALVFPEYSNRSIRGSTPKFVS